MPLETQTQITVSHIHSISGQTDAAALYQAYLERSRTARLAGEKEKLQKRSGTRAFESSIDPEENPDGNAQENNPEEQEPEPENEGFSAKA